MTQFDFESSVDVLSLSSVQKAELWQTVNQLAPRANIGGIIWMSGAGSAHPDVTNNPRFVRYLWLDTQTAGSVLIKIYQGTYPSDTYADWSTLAIADGSITTAKLADYAVTILNGSNASKIAYKADHTADASKSNYILRLDAAGQYVEVASAATIFAPLTVGLNQISLTGAVDGYVLTYSSADGIAKWQAISVVATIADGSLGYSKLVNGTLGYLLRANPTTGVWEQVVNNDSTATGGLFALRSMRLSVLSDSGCTAGDKLVFDGTNWAKLTDFYGAPTVGGTTVPLVTAGGLLYAPHGLGVVPRRVDAYLVCNTNDGNFVAGDKVRADNLIMLRAAAGEQMAACTVRADATNVKVSFQVRAGAGGEYRLIDPVTFARVAITEASWDVMLFASKY